MSLNVAITGNGRNSYATMYEGGTASRYRPHGLCVYTSPFEVLNYIGIFAEDVDGSNELAINATAFGATVENVHNGIDNAYWTASATSGTWTFNSVTQAYAGTRSIDGSATTNGSIARLDAGAPINPNDYDSFKGYFYMDQYNSTGTKGVSVQLYDSSNNPVGNALNLLNYITPTTENVWQAFEIHMSDFGTLGSNVDRLDIIVTSTQGNPIDFYLDNLFFEKAGGREFFIRPSSGDTITVSKIELSIVGASAATRVNDINPIGFGLGAAVANGFVFKTIQGGFEDLTYTLTRNMDFFQFPAATTTELIGNGTTAMFKHVLEYPVPIELNPNTNDYISLRVNDDLSSYTSIKLAATASVVRKPDLTSL